jgi:hypothetical protein
MFILMFIIELFNVSFSHLNEIIKIIILIMFIMFDDVSIVMKSYDQRQAFMIIIVMSKKTFFLLVNGAFMNKGGFKLFIYLFKKNELKI